MKYSKTTLMELSHKYSSILRKCALLNATILLSTIALISSESKAAYDYKYGGMMVNTENTTFSSKSFSGYSIDGAGYGGAIFNSLGILTLNSVTFTDNTATWDGGAISSATSSIQAGTKPSDYPSSVFDENTVRAYWKSKTGFDARNKMVITNSTFDNNRVASYSGGALGVYSDAIIRGSHFMNNNAGGNIPASSTDGGGAIYAGGWARIDISGSDFSSNSSNYGGAIATSQAGKENGVYLHISNSQFTGNTATISGGAIFNDFADTVITDTTFTGNIAQTSGGAIYNKNVLTLSGTNTFSGNKVGSALNDIYNAGTLNVSGSLALDGGIVNTGTITFASGSELKAALNNSTALISGGTVTGTTALIVENGTGNATFKLFDTQQTFDLTNTLYTITDNADGSYAISKKSTSEMVDNLVNGGATAQEAATISAIADTTADNPVLKKITEAVQTGDVKTAAKAANDLAPTTSQAVMGISKDLIGVMANLAGGRMSALAGRAGGDIFKGGSMWVQGLYNHSKQDSIAASEGFKADSTGIALGIDGKLNDALTIGLGYGYTKTDTDAGDRDIDVDGNNFFAYAEYAPDAWYVNGVLNFGYGRYTEKKSPLGYTMKSKYDVYTYGANVMTGYAFDSGLTPEGGLRYLLVDQKSYTDGVEKISTKNNDVLTAVLGAKYGYKVKAKDWMFTPNVRLAATYDLMSDGSKAVAAISGGSSYQITGERLHRFGMEAGVGVTSTWNNWDFTLSYDGGFRKDYQSHTGTLKAKYHF